ncbi:MAG: type II toxin-antitoxin system VapC family toxin [Candidatus Rokubacteria bacterium]|nr:type II toxin-antitoxin system VapC family toxin [Candidatus Rokubacteria bacterium]
MSCVYLDSSALVKLVVREPESAALVEFLRPHAERVSSALALTEVPRALRRGGFGSAERRRARAVLARVALVDVDRRALAAAAVLPPPALGSLDAIHLATALALREDLAALVTYDRRLAAAAERLEVEVRAPA